jgi:hypothetical protein
MTHLLVLAVANDCEIDERSNRRRYNDHGHCMGESPRGRFIACNNSSD